MNRSWMRSEGTGPERIKNGRNHRFARHPEGAIASNGVQVAQRTNLRVPVVVERGRVDVNARDVGTADAQVTLAWILSAYVPAGKITRRSPARQTEPRLAVGV
jgi:hypothetical protein